MPRFSSAPMILLAAVCARLNDKSTKDTSNTSSGLNQMVGVSLVTYSDV